MGDCASHDIEYQDSSRRIEIDAWNHNLISWVSVVGCHESDRL